MNQKKGCGVIFAIPDLGGGGAEKIFVSLIAELKMRNVKLLCLLGSNQKAYDLPKKTRIIKIGTGSALQRITRICTIVQREKPKAVISFRPQMNLDMIVARMKTNIDRLILTHHTTMSSMGEKADRYGSLVRRINRFYPLADTIVAVSEGVKNDLVRNLGLPTEKVSVIYNGIDVDKINRLAGETVREHPWFNEAIPVIVNIGSLRYQKGHIYLLRAFAKLRRKTECRLVILGKGPLAGDLKLTTKRLGIEKLVCFLGFQKNPYKFLKRASVFVLSSVCEGFPTAVLEAMAVGVPVVSTDCKSGPREMIKNGVSGILVPPANAAALADATKKILLEEEYAKRLGSRARKEVDRYNIQTCADRYIALLRG